MSATVRRERNYTQFPRNTKERHLRTCAEQARQQARIQAEMEAAYQEWAPTQIHCAEAMDLADFVAWDVENVEQGLYPGTGASREWAVYVCPKSA